MIPQDAQLTALLFKLIPFLETLMGLQKGSAIALPSAWFLHTRSFSVRVTCSVKPNLKTTAQSFYKANPGRGYSSHNFPSGPVPWMTIGQAPTKKMPPGQGMTATATGTALHSALEPLLGSSLRVLPYVPPSNKPNHTSGWQLTHQVSVRIESDFDEVAKVIDVAKDKRGVARAYRRSQPQHRLPK